MQGWTTACQFRSAWQILHTASIVQLTDSVHHAALPHDRLLSGPLQKRSSRPFFFPWTVPTPGEPLRKMPHVVDNRAGFGGLQAAKKLACKNVRVPEIDAHELSSFGGWHRCSIKSPATAASSPADIAGAGARGVKQFNNLEVMLAEVNQWLWAKKRKTTDHGIAYDSTSSSSPPAPGTHILGHNEW